MINTSLLTISEIADRLCEPPQRVAYVVRKHRIKPAQRVGIIRLFNQDQVVTIKQALQNIQIRREM